MTGTVHVLRFTQANTRLFNIYVPKTWQDPIKTRIQDIELQYPRTKLDSSVLHSAARLHTPTTDWSYDSAVHQVCVSSDGELVISCATSTLGSLAVCRIDRMGSGREYVMTVPQGKRYAICTCLWNGPCLKCRSDREHMGDRLCQMRHCSMRINSRISLEAKCIAHSKQLL